MSIQEVSKASYIKLIHRWIPTSAATSHEFIVYISERLDPRQIPGAEQTSAGREFEAGAGGCVGAGRPTVIHRSQPRNEGGVCVAESDDDDPDISAVVTFEESSDQRNEFIQKPRDHLDLDQHNHYFDHLLWHNVVRSLDGVRQYSWHSSDFDVCLATAV